VQSNINFAGSWIGRRFKIKHIFYLTKFIFSKNPEMWIVKIRLTNLIYSKRQSIILGC
jgi:hypothetical protein